MKSFPLLLQVAHEQNLVMNTIVVERYNGEPMGAICNVEDKISHETKTYNIEYNIVNEILKKQNEELKETGLRIDKARLLGNTNIFCLDLKTYYLIQSNHILPEMLNITKEKLEEARFDYPKSLECSMQDIARFLPQNAKVGVTQLDRIFAFTAIKNHLALASTSQKKGIPAYSQSTAESDLFSCNIKLLKLAGAQIELPKEKSEEEYYTFGNVKFKNVPKIVIMPSFAITLNELRKKIKGKLIISKKSTLILEGSNTTVENLILDSSIWIKNSINALVNIEGIFLEYEQLLGNEAEYLTERGYRIKNTENIRIY